MLVILVFISIVAVGAVRLTNKKLLLSQGF